MDRTLNRTILYSTYAFRILVIFIISSNITQAQNIENNYEATFEFNDENLNIKGKSTYTQFPLMYSFYLERNGSVSCGIHIMYKDGLIKAGEYEIGTDKYPQTYATCSRQDDEVSERISSTSGRFIIEEIKGDVVIGKYNIDMIGGVTSINYNIRGILIAFDMKKVTK